MGMGWVGGDTIQPITVLKLTVGRKVLDHLKKTSPCLPCPACLLLMIPYSFSWHGLQGRVCGLYFVIFKALPYVLSIQDAFIEQLLSARHCARSCTFRSMRAVSLVPQDSPVPLAGWDVAFSFSRRESQGQDG